MGKFDGVLLASDFDDTLVGEDCVISPADRAALEYFTNEGGRFAVSTGRAKRTFGPYAHTVPMNAPAVLGNGSMLYDFERGELVAELPLPQRAADDLLELCEAHPAIGVEVYHGDEVYIHRPNEYTHRHVIRVNTTWTECHLQNMPQPWNKAVIQADPDTLRAAQATLLSRWGDVYEGIFSNPVLLECTAKGASKGGMVLELARILGIERKDIYCVGDNQNDIPMLAVAAIGFAPGNCADAVREWGKARITAPCGACIAEIVDTLDKLYP